MITILLAIALLGQFSDKTETSSLRCFDLDQNQRMCIEEEQESSQSATPSDEFLIEEVNQVVGYDI